MKKTKAVPEAPIVIVRTETTCGKAAKLTAVGTQIHWRPDSAVNYKKPENDLALIIE